MAVAGAVKAMGADLALGQADALNEVLNLGELHAGKAKTSADFLHHPLVFGGVCGSILLQYLRRVLLLQVARQPLHQAVRQLEGSKP